MYDVHFYRSIYYYYYSMHFYACYFLFEGRHWTLLIPSARLESPMSRKTSARVSQVAGCFPLPASHCSRISVLIRSGSFACMWAMFLTLCPVLSCRRRMPNCLYLVPISFTMQTFVLSAHVKISNSGIVGLAVGKQVCHLECYCTADTMYEDRLTIQGKQLEWLACTSRLCSWIIDGQREAAPFLTTHMHRHARMCEVLLWNPYALGSIVVAMLYMVYIEHWPPQLAASK